VLSIDIGTSEPAQDGRGDTIMADVENFAGTPPALTV
jgi:hypothetical protein